jgi:3,4-dihydroxy 2-butanone 4-phosphate synthase/GTP cyclohydrolase II
LARGDELVQFAAEHGLPLVAITDLITFRRRNEPQVRRVAITPIPTEHGIVQVIGYESVHTGAAYSCVVSGEVAGKHDVPVYIHTEHSSGARDRDLHDATSVIAAEGQGVVIHAQSSASDETVALLAELDVRSFRLIPAGRGVREFARALAPLNTGS